MWFSSHRLEEQYFMNHYYFWLFSQPEFWFCFLVRISLLLWEHFFCFVVRIFYHREDFSFAVRIFFYNENSYRVFRTSLLLWVRIFTVLWEFFFSCKNFSFAARIFLVLWEFFPETSSVCCDNIFSQNKNLW